MKTLEQLAVERGLVIDGRELITAGEFIERGIPFFSECYSCGAQLAPYNAFIIPGNERIFCRDCCPNIEE